MIKERGAGEQREKIRGKVQKLPHTTPERKKPSILPSTRKVVHYLQQNCVESKARNYDDYPPDEDMNIVFCNYFHHMSQ